MSPGRSSSSIPIRSLVLAILLELALSGRSVEVGVFGLFHTKVFSVRPCSGGPILVAGRVLEGAQATSITGPARISSPTGGSADILLEVPGKIQRCFHGILTITGQADLTAIVEMDSETAVASIIAAELLPGTPFEALKAQAVVARSFLAASGARHRGFQFCDTTHCQFLRGAPVPGSPAALAAEQTVGLMLTYRGGVIAPAYSAACGGRTLSADRRDYPYQSVQCDYCQRHSTEPVRGHRLGLCQVGAASMAAKGAGLREILNHYYPGTVVRGFPAR